MVLLPVAVYGLEVPAGDIMVPAIADFPATVSLLHHNPINFIATSSLITTLSPQPC